MQRVALALLGQRVLLVLGQQVAVFLCGRHALPRLPQYVHRFGELGEHPGAKPIEERLQHPEGTGEEISEQTAGHTGGAEGIGVAQLLRTLGAKVDLRHLAVDIALIVERSLVLSTTITSHNRNLLAEKSDRMDQDLLKNIGPQRVALLLGDGVQRLLAGGGQKRLPQLPADGLGFHQILGDGPCAGVIQRAADGIDDVHQQRLPVHLHPRDANVAAAAPPRFHNVAALGGEAGGHDVVDLTWHAVEPLRQIAALKLQRAAGLLQLLLNESGDDIRDAHAHIPPFCKIGFDFAFL